jgi:hypothetical protein
MTKDEVMALAKQAGSLIEAVHEKDLLWLIQFAKLVEESTIQQLNTEETS